MFPLRALLAIIDVLSCLGHRNCSNIPTLPGSVFLGIISRVSFGLGDAMRSMMRRTRWVEKANMFHISCGGAEGNWSVFRAILAFFAEGCLVWTWFQSTVMMGSS